MPVLEVVSADGQFVPGAGKCILTTMLVPEGPSDERWHLHLAAQTVDEIFEDAANGVTLTRAAFNLLYDAGRGAVERDQNRRHRHGEHAGDVLLAVRALAREQPAVASLGKAIRMHAADMHNVDREPVLRSESKLRAAWDEFQSVAHFWAACRLLLRSSEYGDGADIDWPLLTALAENLRRWGENHRSPTGSTGTGRTEATLLDPASGWRVPDQALLPYERAAAIDHLRLGHRAAEWIVTTAVAPKKKR